MFYGEAGLKLIFTVQGQGTSWTNPQVWIHTPLKSLRKKALVDLLFFSQLLQDKRGGKVPIFKTIQERRKRSWQWVCCELWFILLCVRIQAWKHWTNIEVWRLTRWDRWGLLGCVKKHIVEIIYIFKHISVETKRASVWSVRLKTVSELITFFCDLPRKSMQGSQSWQTWNLHPKKWLFPNFK